MGKSIYSEALLRRIERLVGQNPRVLRALEKFLDLLEAQPRGPKQPGGSDGRGNWLPILGRSAAGIVFFWDDLPNGSGKNPSDRLSELIEAYLQAETAGQWPACIEAADEKMPCGGADAVSLIQVNVPSDAAVSEFLDCPVVRKSYPDAFALRMDGQSMTPQLMHGDLVIVSPSVPAADGHPAVVQLRSQLGVICKIYRLEGDRVHLIPTNEGFAPETHGLSEVVWALRVLFRVRVSPQPGKSD